MNEESTHGPVDHDQAGRPAPDGGQPPPESTPPVTWNADSAPQQQWDSPVVYPHSDAQAAWNQSPAPGGWSSTPTSVPPQSGPPWSEDPISGSGWAGDVVPQYQPRIPPTPRKQRKPVLQLVIGIVIAAIVAGVGGYFLGAATGGDKATPAPNPTSSAAGQSLFDAAQAASNKTKLDGELAGLAQPWLSSALGACVSNVEKGAPPLAAGESRHVTCRYGSAWVHFVVYKSDTDKTTARTYRQQLNLNSDEVAPGVHDPSRTVGGVSGSPGKVIEYAYRQANGQSLCGLSWERDADPLAAMMIEANCEEDLGGKWEPLRDLWQRHS